MEGSFRRRIGSRLPVKVENRLQSLIDQGYGPAAIVGHLAEEFPDDAPSESTIKRRIRTLRSIDKSGQWSLLDGSPEATGAVLDVLGFVIESTEGRITSLTKTEASWVVRLYAVRPDLPPEDAWFLVRSYVVRDAHGDATDDLDTYLAFAPWRSYEHTVRYSQAINMAGIPPAMIAIHKLIESRTAVMRDEDGTLTPVQTGALSHHPEWPEQAHRRPNQETKDESNG